MDGREDLDSFLGKWHARWPEWRVAAAFLPAARRDAALAWLCLRQELADAAWAGVDPRPGEAKLGWWIEELQAWVQGHARHPLARALQPLAAPWAELATAVPALAQARERAADFDEARQQLQPYAAAAVAVSRALAEEAGGAGADGAGALADTVLGQRLLDGDPSSVPLQVRARLGAEAGEADLRQEAAAMLLRAWPAADRLPRVERIQRALVHARLRALGRRRDGGRPLPGWRALATAWAAARG